MNTLRLSLGVASLSLFALSVYGCSSDSAVIDEDEAGASSSSSGRAKTDAGRSSSSGGKSSSSGSSGRSSSSGSGSTSGGSSSSGDSDPDGGGSSADGGADSGTNDGCTEITATAWTANAPRYFDSPFTPALAGTTDGTIHLDFFNGGNVVGEFDLGSALNANAYSCAQCVEAEAQLANGSRALFFQTAGLLDVESIASYSVTATLTNVTLVEVDEDYEPIANGRCLKISNGTVNVAVP